MVSSGPSRGQLSSLACIPVPGLASALAGRVVEALTLCGLGLLSVLSGAVLAPKTECACPLVGAFAAYCTLGLLGVVLAVRRRGARSPSSVGRRAVVLRRWLAVSVAVLPLTAVLFVKEALVDYYFVPTSSMAPSLRAGDFILVARRAALRPGDVVVFRGPHGRRYVKRVAGIAGDRIAITHGELWRNGEPSAAWLDRTATDPLQGRYFTRTGERGHRVLFERPYLLRASMAELHVPRGHFFVLGDNRDHSDDSRRFGVVPENDLIGRAFSTGPRGTPTGLDWAHAGSLL